MTPSSPGAYSLVTDYLQYIEHVRRFAPDTVRSYHYNLRCFTAKYPDLALTELTIEQVDTYIAEFSEAHKLELSSSNTVRCVLRSFFLYVDRYRNIRLRFDYSMIRQVKAPRKRVSVASSEDVQQMIAALKTPQDKLMMLTMYACGLRIGELVKICVEDIRYPELLVRGKGQKERTIPIDSQLYAVLQNHLHAHNLRTGPLFPVLTPKIGQSGMYTVSGLRKRWQRQLEPLGLYKKPHSLRHGIATELLLDGMDIRTLQEFLGHSNIQTTQLYTHITNRHLQESYYAHTPLRNLSINKILD